MRKDEQYDPQSTHDQAALEGEGREPIAEAYGETRKVSTVKPMDVVRALRPHFHARDAIAKEEIALGIREGRLRIFARTWKSTNRPSENVWQQGPRRQKKRKQVRRQRFLGSKSWEADSKNWKWRSGRFYLTSTDGKSWFLMDRVKFRADDVRNFIDRIKSEKPGAGGRKKNADEWIKAVVRIAEMARNGELTLETLKGEKAFQKAFRDGLPPEVDLNLSDTTLRPLNKAIREHFKPLLESEGCRPEEQAE